MNNPSLSICIPTYNRDIYLKQCLDSIVTQLKHEDFASQIEVIVLDNNSTDNTAFTVQKYTSQWSNFYYKKNPKNIGPVKNIVKVRSLAKGEYVWVLSDDDKLVSDSIKRLLRLIKKHKSDVYYLNVALFSRDLKQLNQNNVLHIKTDHKLNGKKDFFHLLQSFFPNIFLIDWYTTFISNLIIRKKIVDDNKKKITSYLKNGKGYYPHFFEILLTPHNYSFYTIASIGIKYRSDNASFLNNAPFENYRFITDITTSHYVKMLYENKKYVTITFKIFILLKFGFMYMRLTQLFIVSKLRFFYSFSQRLFF